ncbi:MAG: ABC transporter ATP-binding protein/permease [Myxococcales bacterium]|nr:ABC transporter ATP-binding protein/permease [Myxococcales bacterium]
MSHHAPTDDSVKARLDWSIIKRLFPFIGAHRQRVALAVVLLLLAKAATVAVPLLLKAIVDALDSRAQLVLVLPLGMLIAYGALRLVSTLFRQIQSVVFTRVRHGIMRQIATRVLSHLHSLSLRFHLTRKTGAIARDIGRGTSSVSSLLSYLLFNLLPTIAELAMVLTILLFTYDVWFVVVTLICFLAYGVFTFSVTQWRMRFRIEMNRLDSEASNRAIDSLLNYETVKYFNNEGHEVEQYNAGLASWENLAVKTETSLSVLNVGQGLIIASGVTVTMILAARGVLAGRMSIGDLVAVNAFLLQLFMPLGFLGTIYSLLKNALADMERMFDLLEIPPEIVDDADAAALDVRAGEVVFDTVDFGYDGDRQVLFEISFRIPAGRKVAVVGASGSGKSTLARLLFRFYDVDRGEIRIDGQNIRRVSQDSLRRAIGIVPQDTVLFNDTIYANLRYANLDATQEEIEQAAKMAQIHDFIASLPKGYQSVVGERGLKLSGGEKQRVAIARAILKRPTILIFDEATSSLDSESEQAILNALADVAANHTTLVIAHRLSTIADADEILVMEKGRIVERGDHDSLLASAGVYANLWKIQQKEKEASVPLVHAVAN